MKNCLHPSSRKCSNEQLSRDLQGGSSTQSEKTSNCLSGRPKKSRRKSRLRKRRPSEQLLRTSYCMQVEKRISEFCRGVGLARQILCHLSRNDGRTNRSRQVLPVRYMIDSTKNFMTERLSIGSYEQLRGCLHTIVVVVSESTSNLHLIKTRN